MKVFDSVKNGNKNQIKKESKEMMRAPQELLKEYVKSQDFTSTAEIMTAMKEMFRDVVQTAMEEELDEELGRERCQRAQASETAPNYRNGYSLSYSVVYTEFCGGSIPGKLVLRFNCHDTTARRHPRRRPTTATVTRTRP